MTFAGNRKLERAIIGDEVFYRITSADTMRPFLMSIVSDSNHWMFIASNGGITAGRKNPDQALFPYYTEDKITESPEGTGSKTIIRVLGDDQATIWEPFSIRHENLFSVTTNLYKSVFGNKIIFEAVNHNLGLVFQYEWNSSNLFGFVKRSRLLNQSGRPYKLRILDGLQNILPFGIGSDLQNKSSNLADAYKRSELVAETGMGIFALSANITDKAEPSEALKANIAWSAGLHDPVYLLSARQLNAFRANAPVHRETDIKGEKGAYFVISETPLKQGEQKEWMTVANVNQHHAAIIALCDRMKKDLQGLVREVSADTVRGTENLKKLVFSADGLQCTGDDLRDTRHYANVLFNIMRGGIFHDNYRIVKRDFSEYLRKANRQVFGELGKAYQQLPENFTLEELHHAAAASGHTHFIRLATEYLPLKFSRRHGDPSRPWNLFSINTRSEKDGSEIFDYQGNWRDIFQNWEALAHAYPAFTPGMIFKFLNASTFEGYNPYRVTRDGFDWETIEPDNPWSYIGYWGDHQVIYLLKLLEFTESVKPGFLGNLLDKNWFVYAHIPYKIKSYSDILKDPKNTIDFDEENDLLIRKRMAETGADGALLTGQHGGIVQVCFAEKILATVLSRISNFIPGGGIWMNTQRPEWNDANNALVGNGVSMVTLCYLQRFLRFLQPLFETAETKEYYISTELLLFFNNISDVLQSSPDNTGGQVTEVTRRKMMDQLGQAGSVYRELVYRHRFSGNKESISSAVILSFIRAALVHIGDTIRVNKRTDGMFHSYNLVSYDDHSARISHLSEMLEGQVAALSAGSLSADDSLALLNALRKSNLYREDQHSYMLYPNRALPGFLEKNRVPADSVFAIALLKRMAGKGDTRIVEQDVIGDFHFNGNFRNVIDLETALAELVPDYPGLVAEDSGQVLQLFEATFNHKAFTGRSGTFFAYEGLGSVYWHMVSKLLLAVQETFLRAVPEGTPTHTMHSLAEHYYAIKEGIGVHKRPDAYGAFPTDPYSHTPLGKGAQQPGMTGQVKEDILSCLGELGVTISQGRLGFIPLLLRKREFLTEPGRVEYIDVLGTPHSLELASRSLFFTCCQVPVIYVLGVKNGMEVLRSSGRATAYDAPFLSKEDSDAVFNRNNQVRLIRVFIAEVQLNY